MAKFATEPGMRLGPCNILYISRDYKDQNGKWFGTFECPICHKHFQTRVSRIQCGDTKTCGCTRPNLKDLTDQQFDKLKVICLDESIKGAVKGAYWICECTECGERVSLVPPL